MKKKLTATQKADRKKAKEERKKLYEYVFMNGKQVRVKRPITIDGVPVDEFILQNADISWLHQNEMWELIDHQVDDKSVGECRECDENDVPF